MKTLVINILQISLFLLTELKQKEKWPNKDVAKLGRFTLEKAEKIKYRGMRQTRYVKVENEKRG